MKNRNISIAIGLLAATLLGAVSLNAAKPGYLPITESLARVGIQPTVNLNMPKFLLNEVIEGYEADENNPFEEMGIDLKAVIADIKSIRLVVYEDAETSEDYPVLMKAVEALNKELQATWIPVVSVPEENVGIFTVSDESGERMAGLAIVVAQDDSVVIGNIEGRFPIGAILRMVANSDALPEDLMEKLAQAGSGGETENGDK